MKTLLYQLIQFIILIFFTIKVLAINDTMYQDVKIKNYNKTITCNDCCFPVDSESCLIFYIICKTKTYSNGIFVFNTKIITDFSNIKNIKQLHKVILIVKNKIIRFEFSQHNNFYSEILENIKTMQDQDKILSNAKVYKNITSLAIRNLESPLVIIKNKELNIFLIDIKFKPAYTALQAYNALILSDLNNNIVRIYNKNNIENCKKIEPNISTIIHTSIAPTFMPTLIRTTNYSGSNNLINLKNTDIFKVNNKSNKIDVLLIVSIILGLIIVVVIPIIIYKIYKKKNLNKQLTTRNSLKEDNQNSETISEEHIYEEPDEILSTIIPIDAYNEVNDFIPGKNDDDIIVVYNPQKQQHNLNCLNNDKIVNNVSDDLEDNNQIIISTNFVSSRTNTLKLVENDQIPNIEQADSIQPHEYHVLEASNNANNTNEHFYQPLIKRDSISSISSIREYIEVIP